MSASTLRALVALLLASIVAWGVVSLNSRIRERRDAGVAIEGLFDGITEAVVAVRMTGREDTIRLEREDGSWSVNGLRTDARAVARFWSALDHATVGEIIADNPSNHPRMGVVADSARRVEFDLGGSTRTVLLGSEGPRRGTMYARLPGKPDVFLLHGELRILRHFSLDDWRDRRILSVDTSMVARVEVELDRERYVLVRDARGWRVKERGEADTAKVRMLLGQLADLRARDFLDPTDAIARRPYSGRVTALSGTGKTLAALSLGAPGAGLDRWARADDDSTLYRLGYYYVDRLAPPLQELQVERR